MGKKINFRANDLYMFRLFKQIVHQTEKNEFYVDGTCVEENPGVIVDFRNIEHTYEIFKLLGSSWGGWNATPTSQKMYQVSKIWEEKFAAEIIDIGNDSIDFRLGRKLSDKETDVLFDEIKELNAEANCTGGFVEMRTVIKEKQKFCIWWD